MTSPCWGRRLVPTFFLGCRACEPCLSGDERMCEREGGHTIDPDEAKN